MLEGKISLMNISKIIANRTNLEKHLLNMTFIHFNTNIILLMFVKIFLSNYLSIFTYKNRYIDMKHIQLFRIIDITIRHINKFAI